MEQQNNYKPKIALNSLFLLIYMNIAIATVYIPIYLIKIGHNKTSIGIIMAMNSLISLIAQPLFCYISDRANSKNNVLKILLILSAVSMIAFSLNKSFIYLFLITIIFSLFQTPVIPISDSIALEYSDSYNMDFGHIRTYGTVGFAIMAAVLGQVLKDNLNIIFITYAVISIFLIFIFKFMPDGNKNTLKDDSVKNNWSFIKNKEFILIITSTFLVQLTIGYYLVYFPIYYNEMGANNKLLGYSMLIAALSELPFLLFADKIIKKISIKYTIIFAAFIASIRWLLLYFCKNIYIILASQILHGLTFIVLVYAMTVYINSKVSEKLKASGQALNSIVCISCTRIISSVLGGVFSDMVGIKNMFLYITIISLISVILPLMVKLENNKEISYAK